MRHRSAALTLAGLLLAASCGGAEEAGHEASPRASPSPGGTQPAEPTTTPSRPGEPTTPSRPAGPPTPAPDEGEADESPTEPPEHEGNAEPLAGAVVALDPGHNGRNADHPDEVGQPVDAGGLTKQCNTVGTSTEDGYTEAAFNWDLAQLVRDKLEAAGAEVHLSREGNDGWGPCIDERGKFAGDAGADLLVSIHADGAPPEGHGFHVIHPDVVEGHTEHIVDDSTALAHDLRDALVDAEQQPSTYAGADGLVQREDLGTLNRADVPAALTEMGNMRNPGDAAELSSAAGREHLADALVDGIAAFITDR